MGKSIYCLCYDTDTTSIIFYVGCTDNVKRRTNEHNKNPFNKNHSEYDTYKYQWCRQLREQGIDYRLEVLVNQADVNDENDEYEWILKFARYNQENQIEFIDHQPLTNMKAGDFFEEMIRDRTVNTAKEISAYRQRWAAAEREIKYTRDNQSFGNQSMGMFGRLFTPEKLDSMRIKTKPKRSVKGYDHSEARAQWIKQQTQDMIDRDRSEGRNLPGGVSDEKS